MQNKKIFGIFVALIFVLSLVTGVFAGYQDIMDEDLSQRWAYWEPYGAGWSNGGYNGCGALHGTGQVLLEPGERILQEATDFGLNHWVNFVYVTPIVRNISGVTGDVQVGVIFYSGNTIIDMENHTVSYSAGSGSCPEKSLTTLKAFCDAQLCGADIVSKVRVIVKNVDGSEDVQLDRVAVYIDDITW